MDGFNFDFNLDEFFVQLGAVSSSSDAVLADTSTLTSILQIDPSELDAAINNPNDIEVVNLTEESNINLQLTKTQLDIISEALEIYTRLGVLQLSKAILPCIQDNNKFSYYKNKRQIIILLKQIRNMLIEDNIDLEHYSNDMSDWSLGIGNDNVPMDVKLAGELHHAIEHFKFKNHASDSDLKYSKPLPHKLTDTPTAIIKTK